MKRYKIFISHATADKRVIERLFDLLNTGVGIVPDDIFCSNVEGAGITTGHKFAKWIKESLVDSELIVLVLSNNYYANNFCVAEMGAAWISGNDVFPLMLGDIGRNPRAVLSGIQSKVFDKTGLNDLRDQCILKFPNALGNTNRWDEKKEELLKDLPALIRSLPEPELVSKMELNKLEKELSEQKRIREIFESQISEKDRMISELKRLKDQEQVKDVESKFVPIRKRYNDLISNIKTQCKSLGPIPTTAIFYRTINDEWRPDREIFSQYQRDFEINIQKKLIKEDEGIFKVSEDHKQTTKLLSLIDELDSLLTSGDASNLVESLADERSYPIDIKNRDFWTDEMNVSLI